MSWVHPQAAEVTATGPNADIVVFDRWEQMLDNVTDLDGTPLEIDMNVSVVDRAVFQMNRINCGVIRLRSSKTSRRIRRRECCQR